MRGNPKQSTKSNITLSMDNDILGTIKSESEGLGISLNSKISSILEDYVLFGKYFADSKPVVMAPEVFSFMIENIDEKKHLELWKFVLQEVNTRIFAMHNIPLTFENVVNHALNEIGIRVGVWSNCKTNQIEDATSIIIRHDFGPKWSRIVSEALSFFIRDKFNKTVHPEILPDTIKLTVKQ